MATIPIIQLLRNNNIYSTRDAARSALEGQKNNVPDGGVILARYSGTTGEQKIIKTLAGFVSNISTPENATVTIIDVEGASENVQEAITSAINKLNKEDTAAVGQYVSSVSEENGIIKVTRNVLPFLNRVAFKGEAVTAITQTNGQVSVEFGGIDAYNVSLTDVHGRFESENVGGALFEIKDSINEAMGSVGMMIDGKINAINSSPSFQSQHIIVSLNQNNGRIDSVFVHEDNIASASLLGTTSDTKDNETAFGRIAKEVAAREDAIDALSTSSTVTLESVDETEGFLKVYTIKQGDRKVGTINIPKDLVVTSGSVVKGTWDGNTFTEDVSGSGTSTGTALKLVIANQTNPVYINTLDLVKDHTGGNGISISDTNAISVQIAEGSENFLTVDADGVKLSGVQAAIDAAAASAKTKVEKTDGGSHVTLTSTTSTTDSSVTYTISESDIASEAALTAEVNDRQSADTTLQNNIDNVHSTLTAHTADTTIHVTQADKDKWNKPTDLSNYYTKSEVDEKDAAINATIESYGQVTSQALNDLGTRLDDYGKVTSQSLNDLSTKFGDYYTKTEVDTAISNVDVTGQLQNYYTKTEVDSKDATLQTALDALSSSIDTKIASETTERQNADNTLQGNINNVNSGLTAHTANTTVHVTQADKDKWNTPTDLSNYYTKAEVDGKDATLQTALDALGAHVSENEDIVSQSLNDLNKRIGNTYVKSYIDALEARIAELETKFLNMENNGLQAGEY